MNAVLALYVQIVRILPTNAISYLTGVLSRIRLPGPVQRILNAAFVRLFEIDVSEADQELAAYRSIEDVFTRRLKPGLRPIHATEAGLVMPCDGTLCLAGAILSSGEAIQAKGISYGTHSLVFGSGPIDPNFIPTFFATIYLAPHNYHRVHSPVTGTLRAIRYIPGRLLPVNRLFAGLCPALFTENERMVFDIRTPQGGTIKVVMVGAFNVGRIHSPFWPEMNTNNFERQWDGRIGHQEICYSFPVSAGDELGVFMLGSTTVMVFDKIAAKAYTLEARNEPSTVRLGELFARSNHSKGDPGEVD